MRKDPNYLRGISDALLGVALELTAKGGDGGLLKDVLSKAQGAAQAANDILNEADDENDKFAEAMRRVFMDLVPQIGPVMSKLFEDIIVVKPRTDGEDDRAGGNGDEDEAAEGRAH